MEKSGVGRIVGRAGVGVGVGFLQAIETCCAGSATKRRSSVWSGRGAQRFAVEHRRYKRRTGLWSWDLRVSPRVRYSDPFDGDLECHNPRSCLPA